MTHECLQAEGQQRKAADEPLLQAPFTAELGGVAPVFITPGNWTRQDMERAAQTIWFGATSNAGCNCVAPRAIIMSSEWPQVRASSRTSVSHNVQRGVVPD
ncbi:MAG: aldehyde dehydrogenase family protein [Akkermansiaceae bacterium]|nr:aldehyde dehydrogenase family protein [Akkermansiaceae bacterium]